MRDKLLLIIHRLSKADRYGRADESDCRKQFGEDEEAFERLINELDKLGYLIMKEVGAIELSGYGLREAERLESRRR
jgi:Mn-dependent DtxR family transcriptional regulator